MIELTETPLDPSAVLALVADPECGAEVLFLGTTRQWTDLPADAAWPTATDVATPEECVVHSPQRRQSPLSSSPAADTGQLAARANEVRRVETSHLVYESYREMALAQLQRLEAEARSRWPLRKVAIVHRLGHVAATEASVAIAVSSPHRGEAFEAARWLIDELKHQVPIWKQEHYVQHGAQWIHPTTGNCSCVGPAQHGPVEPTPADVSPLRGADGWEIK